MEPVNIPRPEMPAAEPVPAGSATSLRTSLARVLSSALRPDLAGELARLRRTEVRLTRLAPKPTAIAVLGVTQEAGTSTLAALLSQVLTALAPGRVAALDGDGKAQALRHKLGVGDTGDLRCMLADPQVWRTRRAIDRYLASRGPTPLLAAAIADHAHHLSTQELQAALTLLRRRFPVVIADLPAHATARYEPIALAADHVLVVGEAGPTLARASQWVADNRSDHPSATMTVVAPGPPQAAPATRFVTEWFPVDSALVSGTVRLGALRLATLGAVEAVTARITEAWR